MQLEKVKRAGRDLVSTNESPSLKAVDILCAAGDNILAGLTLSLAQRLWKIDI